MKEIDFLALITDKVNKANIDSDSTIVRIEESVDDNDIITMTMLFYRQNGVFKPCSLEYKYHPHLSSLYQDPTYCYKHLREEEYGFYLREYDTVSKMDVSCLGGHLDISDVLNTHGLVCSDPDGLNMLSILTNCAAIELEQYKLGRKLKDDDVLSMSFDGICYHPLKMTVVDGDNTPHYIANKIEETNFGTVTTICLDNRRMWFPIEGTFAYNVALKWMVDLVRPYAKYRVALLERSFDPDCVVTKDGKRVTTRYAYTVATEDVLPVYTRLNEDGEFMAIEDAVKEIYSYCAKNNLHVKNVRLTVPDEDDIDLYKAITYELE